MKVLGAACLLVIAGVGAIGAQPMMQNRTNYPDHIAAARFLGIVDAIIRRCANLEIEPDGEAALLRMGPINRQDIEASAQLRLAYDGGELSIGLQEFDPECAGPLRRMNLFLRTKPGQAAPVGPGWTRQYVTSSPLP